MSCTHPDCRLTGPHGLLGHLLADLADYGEDPTEPDRDLPSAPTTQYGAPDLGLGNPPRTRATHTGNGGQPRRP